MRRLERWRKKATKQSLRTVREARVELRKAAAQSIEYSLLDNGIDAKVRVGGRRKDRLKIIWVLFNRASVHQLAKDPKLLGQWEKMGFSRVTFSDGYGESWYYDLSPPGDDTDAKKILKKMGLAEPLSISRSGP